MIVHVKTKRPGSYDPGRFLFGEFALIYLSGSENLKRLFSISLVLSIEVKVFLYLVGGSGKFSLAAQFQGEGC